MVAPKLPENIDEPLISAPVAPAELVAGPAEPKKLADPVADLKKAKNMPEAIEIMVALLEDHKVKMNERDEYAPVDPKDPVAKEAIRVYKILEKNFKAAASPSVRATESRTRIETVVNAPKPQLERAKVEKAPELILISPEEYHKLDLFKEENKPLPESRIYDAAKSIAETNPSVTNARLAVLDHLVLKQSEELAERMQRQVEQIKTTRTLGRLSEITDDLLKKGWLIRRAYDIIANPNFNPTQGLENALRAKENEIEAHLNTYNEIINEPNGLEIKIKRVRRVGRETKEYSDRYAVRFVFGDGGKTVRIAKVVKLNPNSQDLETGPLYTLFKRPPAWLDDSVELKNGQFSLKKPVSQAPKKEEPKAEKEAENLQADKPAQKPQPKLVAKLVEAKKPNPIHEKEQALSRLIKDNLEQHPELKLITSVMHAVSTKRPMPSRPSASLEQLADILKNAFANSGNLAPKSLNDLAKAGFEPNLGSLLEIAKTMESELEKFPLAEKPTALHEVSAAEAKQEGGKVA